MRHRLCLDRDTNISSSGSGIDCDNGGTHQLSLEDLGIKARELGPTEDAEDQRTAKVTFLASSASNSCEALPSVQDSSDASAQSTVVVSRRSLLLQVLLRDAKGLVGKPEEFETQTNPPVNDADVAKSANPSTGRERGRGKRRGTRGGRGRGRGSGGGRGRGRGRGSRVERARQRRAAELLADLIEAKESLENVCEDGGVPPLWGGPFNQKVGDGAKCENGGAFPPLPTTPVALSPSLYNEADGAFLPVTGAIDTAHLSLEAVEEAAAQSQLLEVEGAWEKAVEPKIEFEVLDTSKMSSKGRHGQTQSQSHKENEEEAAEKRSISLLAVEIAADSASIARRHEDDEISHLLAQTQATLAAHTRLTATSQAQYVARTRHGINVVAERSRVHGELAQSFIAYQTLVLRDRRRRRLEDEIREKEVKRRREQSGRQHVSRVDIAPSRNVMLSRKPRVPVWTQTARNAACSILLPLTLLLAQRPREVLLRAEGADTCDDNQDRTRALCKVSVQSLSSAETFATVRTAVSSAISRMSEEMEKVSDGAILSS